MYWETRWLGWVGGVIVVIYEEVTTGTLSAVKKLLEGRERSVRVWVIVIVVQVGVTVAFEIQQHGWWGFGIILWMRLYWGGYGYYGPASAYPYYANPGRWKQQNRYLIAIVEGEIWGEEIWCGSNIIAIGIFFIAIVILPNLRKSWYAYAPSLLYAFYRWNHYDQGANVFAVADDEDALSLSHHLPLFHTFSFCSCFHSP